MSIDAGLQAIVAGYAPPGITAEGEADLALSIGRLATEYERERRYRESFQQKMQLAIRDTPLLSVTAPSGTPTFASPDWVCKTGYEWFAQLFTAKGLAGTDTLWIYRTSASGGQQVGDSAARWLLNATAPAWAPGRTGFAMKPGDGIVLQGTTTAAVTVNIDVIIVEQWLVPDFLL